MKRNQVENVVKTKKRESMESVYTHNSLRKEKGITLIALVITIIVLLILAGVTISSLSGENGILKRAQEAKDKTIEAQEQEERMLAELENLINDSFENEPPDIEDPPDTGEKPIDKAEPKVGYYADIDGDTTPDGVIYADLAVSKSGQWMNSNGAYSYTAITNTKDYYISQTNYEGPFGTKDVLTAIDGEGKERFYVMSLEDFDDGTSYCWYNAAFGNMKDYSTTTSLDFGAGRTNTEAMIAKWNGGAYGPKNNDGTNLDMWGVIQDKVDEGWFVPSREEWGAFGDNLGIRTNNYENYGLSGSYWSSSQYDENAVWSVNYSNDWYIKYVDPSGIVCIRLSATF